MNEPSSEPPVTRTPATAPSSRRGLNHVVTIDGVVAYGGMGQILRASNLNPFALLAELVINGELAPHWVGVTDLPVEEPKEGALPQPIMSINAIRRIYAGADQLRMEHDALAARDPAKARQQIDDLHTAIHPGLLKKPHIAIKVLRPVMPEESDDDNRTKLMRDYGRRFIQENHMLRRLDHPGIVGRYGLVYDPVRGWCLLLEYIEGENLQEVLAKQPLQRLPLADAARLSLQVAEALHHIHSRHIIHRDIKPSNIMVNREGSAIITDFGIGRWEESGVTIAGSVVGTPDYMAPEQVSGQALHATDVYQLGTLMFRMVTGRLPYEEVEPQHLLAQISRADADHPTYVYQFRPEISSEFEAIIEKARDKNPAERWTSAELVAELRELKVVERDPRLITAFTLRRRMKALKWEQKRIETTIHYLDLEERLAAAEQAIDKRDADALAKIEALEREIAELSARYDPLRSRITTRRRELALVLAKDQVSLLLGDAERASSEGDHVACGALLRQIAIELPRIPADRFSELHRRSEALQERLKPLESFLEVFDTLQKSFVERVAQGVRELRSIPDDQSIPAERIEKLLRDIVAGAGMLKTINPSNIGPAFGRSVHALAQDLAALKELAERVAPDELAALSTLGALVVQCAAAIEAKRP